MEHTPSAVPRLEAGLLSACGLPASDALVTALRGDRGGGGAADPAAHDGGGGEGGGDEDGGAAGADGGGSIWRSIYRDRTQVAVQNSNSTKISVSFIVVIVVNNNNNNNTRLVTLAEHTSILLLFLVTIGYSPTARLRPPDSKGIIATK